ncbi:hypothetical protein HBA54_03255 [Pelagibius litoralis]|uniref:Uncharacterized protein n=1 Tax=Pelagibius litoralis TaxID=374515 RepID=A0A967C371_9PROT|nr:hypothetical protein [Pelagibius litoralis]NIA67600.1 hypothetical protein [Pelagibius litoralis]
MAELQAMGLDGLQIMTLVNARFPGTEAAPAAAPLTPGSGEALGPDPERIAAYNKMMEDYVPPVLDRKVGCLTGDDADLRQVVAGALASADPEDGVDAVTDALMAALDGYGGVTLPIMFSDWVRKWAMILTMRHKREELMPDDEALGIMIKEHWASHTYERALMNNKPGSKSGPRKSFNPTSGTWQ